MKKLNVMLTCLVAFFCATSASAQFNWGLEGGMNLSKVSVKNDEGLFDSSNRTGWFIGPKAQFVMPVIGLGLDGAILYSQKYMKLEETEESGSLNKSLPYLEIPINVRYNFGFSSLLGVYIATGPQYNWYLGSRNLKLNNNNGNIGTLERSTFSWNVGAGFIMLSHLQLGFTYNIALGETGQLDNVTDVVEVFDIKNNSWQIRLAYLF